MNVRMTKKCPLCGTDGESFVRISDMPTITCTRLAMGETRMFPKLGVVVIGGGVGVEQDVPSPELSAAETATRLAKLEQEVAQKKVAERTKAATAAAQDRIAHLEKVVAGEAPLPDDDPEPMSMAAAVRAVREQQS